MVRPLCRRIVSGTPANGYFKPMGIPRRELAEVILSIDEYEAIRLADGQGLYQEEAAKYMDISRQTFGRILESAHRKIADALVNGKAIRIEGGVIEVAEMRRFRCVQCGEIWDVPYGTGRSEECPRCRSQEVHRVHGSQPEGRGRGRHGQGGRRWRE